MSHNAGTLFSGLIFGSALTISGVASPQVIRNQFKLSDYHMLVTLLSASASSATVLLAYNSRAGDKRIPVRSVQRQTSWITDYDSHVLGGAMVGLGMALTGACPGTVLIQAAAGIGHSRIIALSSVVAGALFARWKKSWGHIPNDQHQPPSVMTATGMSTNKAVLVYNSMVFAMILAVLVLASRSRALVHPVVGGLLIGCGQLASLVLAGKAVGVSTAYEATGKALLDIFGGRPVKKMNPSIVFAFALVAGAKMTMLCLPGVVEKLVPLKEQSIWAAVMGGFLLSFGSRLAGGCTSGHGISGMAGMSLSSFATVAAMFGAGLLTCIPFM